MESGPGAGKDKACPPQQSRKMACKPIDSQATSSHPTHFSSAAAPTATSITNTARYSLILISPPCSCILCATVDIAKSVPVAKTLSIHRQDYLRSVPCAISEYGNVQGCTERKNLLSPNNPTNKKKTRRGKPVVLIPVWCGREDLNLHELPRQILSLVRLPFRHARMMDLEI
jgi:hypothetical protein